MSQQKPTPKPANVPDPKFVDDCTKRDISVYLLSTYLNNDPNLLTPEKIKEVLNSLNLTNLAQEFAQKSFAMESRGPGQKDPAYIEKIMRSMAA